MENLGLLESEAASYIEANWENVLADMDRLIKIPSVEELDKAAPGAPFGPGPRRALSCALEIAANMGFEAHDVDGFIGYADLPGASDTQIGLIAHTDVVPAGPGWTFEPFALTRKDGYLLGRGTSDDKGPLVIALHALRFWQQKAQAAGAPLPYTVRFLFGANEETGMQDVAYYRQRFADPAFLFTPDAEFPLSYGESGCCVGELESPAFVDGNIARIEGGAATNAVPGEASALVWVAQDKLPQLQERAGISVALATEEAYENDALGEAFAQKANQVLVRVRAKGKSAHASTPELGQSAIALLVGYLLDAELCAPAERTFFAFLQTALVTDGSGLGIAATDSSFGALTSVGGVIGMRGGKVVQSIDCRYPTSITGAEIGERIGAAAAKVGATFTLKQDKKPFLISPDSPAVRALMQAYNQVTGKQCEPFTMKGGTYARLFSNAVSFGPEEPASETPSWVGGMHGPDEGVSEEGLKRAMKIYIVALGLLFDCEL